MVKYYENPKQELSILASLASSMVVRAIRDYSKTLTPRVEKNKFQVKRNEMDSENGIEAISWFNGVVKKGWEGNMSFKLCCELIQGALSDKPVIVNAARHNKDGIVLRPSLLCQKILQNPEQMHTIFSELETLFRNTDVFSKEYHDVCQDDTVSFMHFDDLRYLELTMPRDKNEEDALDFIASLDEVFKKDMDIIDIKDSDLLKHDRV